MKEVLLKGKEKGNGYIGIRKAMWPLKGIKGMEKRRNLDPVLQSGRNGN